MLVNRLEIGFSGPYLAGRIVSSLQVVASDQAIFHLCERGGKY